MFDIQKPIPAYITNKRNIISLIFFTAIFALVFINVYSPFGITTVNLTEWQPLVYSSLITLIGVLVVVVSRLIMYYVSKRKEISYWNYSVWVLSEVFFMAMFYALYVKIYQNDATFFLSLIKQYMLNTALVLLLPYAITWLYFSWKDKNELLEQLTSGQVPAAISKNMIPFYDEKGLLRISLKLENLLYLEASDNYVNIYYLNKEKVSKFMLRNSLKKLEESLICPEILRCHRSYMVNFEKIKIVRKEKDGFKLEFDSPVSMDIPVSKSYVENIMSTFLKFNDNAMNAMP
jgi:DNA-binding LytR/AlgR family response regulator